MALLETVVRDRCGVHAARLLRIIMQVCRATALMFDAAWCCLLSLLQLFFCAVARARKMLTPGNRNFQKMKMETRSVWDYGLVSPKTIGRPALYVPLPVLSHFIPH